MVVHAMLIALKKQDNLKPRLVLSAIESVQLANLMTATKCTTLLQVHLLARMVAISPEWGDLS